MDKDASVIPYGPYCYTPIKNELGNIMRKRCPYWERLDNVPEQDSGYCHYLEAGDLDGTTMLLWDQCKECGINWDD